MLLVLRALNGERTAEEAVNGALKGDSDPENEGEGGIRRRPSHDVERAEDGYVKEADVGKGGATVVVGDLCDSQLHEQSLCSLDPVDGAEVGVVLPDDFSLGATGLVMAMVLRKSV